MPWTCFWLEPTDRERCWLRGFTLAADGECPTHPKWGHDAQVQIEDGILIQTPQGLKSAVCEWPHEDPRWPTQCSCGYVFQAADQWQLFRLTIYRRPDTGAEYTLRDAPAGGMWDARWMPKGMRSRLAPDDGLQLMCKVPGGHDWHIDGPSSNGPGWSRQGKPPEITAFPSISAPNYHGWLAKGILSDDLEGRKYG